MQDVFEPAGEDMTGAPIGDGLVSPSPAAPPPATSGRRDFDQLVTIKGIPPGMPYFLLKGHDSEAPGTLRDYAARIHRAGADVAVVESALQLADLMEEYPETRLVNGSHLSEAEAKHLRYQFSQRAKRAALGAPTRTDKATNQQIMLAEERAAQSILSRLRPVLVLLLQGGSWRADGAFVFDPDARQRGEPEEDLPLLPCPIEQLKAYLESGGRDVPARRTNNDVEAAARRMAAAESPLPWIALLPSARRTWRQRAMAALGVAEAAA